MIQSNKGGRSRLPGGDLGHDVSLPGKPGGLNLNEGFSNAPGYSGLAGRGDPPAPDIFVCPQDCKYQWRRFFVADPIPECPTHHVKLVPAPVGLGSLPKQE